MDRLSDTIQLALDRAKKRGKDNLSRFELMKIPYLVEVESLRFAGQPFFSNIRFVREENGPISTSIYNAIVDLHERGKIKIHEQPNPGYGSSRICHSLVGNLEISLSNDEVLFVDSILHDALSLNQKELQRVAYNTEPMKKIVSQEDGGEKFKGAALEMNLVGVDPDVVDQIADELQPG